MHLWHSDSSIPLTFISVPPLRSLALRNGDLAEMIGSVLGGNQQRRAPTSSHTASAHLQSFDTQERKSTFHPTQTLAIHEVRSSKRLGENFSPGLTSRADLYHMADAQSGLLEIPSRPRFDAYTLAENPGGPSSFLPNFFKYIKFTSRIRRRDRNSPITRAIKQAIACRWRGLPQDSFYLILRPDLLSGGCSVSPSVRIHAAHVRPMDD